MNTKIASLSLTLGLTFGLFLPNAFAGQKEKADFDISAELIQGSNFKADLVIKLHPQSDQDKNILLAQDCLGWSITNYEAVDLYVETCRDDKIGELEYVVSDVISINDASRYEVRATGYIQISQEGRDEETRGFFAKDYFQITSDVLEKKFKKRPRDEQVDFDIIKKDFYVSGDHSHKGLNKYEIKWNGRNKNDVHSVFILNGTYGRPTEVALSQSYTTQAGQALDVEYFRRHIPILSGLFQLKGSDLYLGDGYRLASDKVISLDKKLKARVFYHDQSFSHHTIKIFNQLDKKDLQKLIESFKSRN